MARFVILYNVKATLINARKSRWYSMTADLTTTNTGTRSRLRSGKSGTQRKWNANGTQMERIYERVPDAFSVRLFLSSTVFIHIRQEKSPTLTTNASHALILFMLLLFYVSLRFDLTSSRSHQVFIRACCLSFTLLRPAEFDSRALSWDWPTSHTNNGSSTNTSENN